MSKSASWDVTSRCNLRCAHCAVSETYRRRQLAGSEVTYEEGLAILQRLRQAGYDQLVLIGGEPLMRDDIIDLVAAARCKGFLYVAIVTNGTRLTPQLADALLGVELNDLIVSLDGATAQTNDQVRGKGSYVQAIRGLETVLKRRSVDSRLRIALQFTLSRVNLHEITKIVDLAGQLGVDRLSINELRLAGKVWQNVEQLLPSIVEAMDARESLLQAATRYPGLMLQIFGRPRAMEYLNERFGKNFPLSGPDCSLVNGYKMLYVRADGSASPCSAVHVEDAATTPGQDVPTEFEDYRLQTHSLSSILASPRFDRVKRIVNQAVVEEHWQDGFVPCIRCQYRPVCRICPLFLREQKDKMIRECLLALQRQARWRKSQKQVRVTDQEMALARGVGHV